MGVISKCTTIEYQAMVARHLILAGSRMGGGYDMTYACKGRGYDVYQKGRGGEILCGEKGVSWEKIW